jgi:hypothetical protein
MKLLRSTVFLKGYGWEPGGWFVVILFMKLVMTRYHDASGDSFFAFVADSQRRDK